MDLVGAELFARLVTAEADHGRRVTVVGAPPAVRQLLAVAGVGPLVESPD